LQFYRSNRELSQTVKESVKTELTRAKNNYKSVFAHNYLEWMQYESNGSPRLNKHARRMQLTYCTFPAEVREKLMLNPTFAELINRFNVKYQMRTQYLNRVIHRYQQHGKKVPQEILDELEYSKR
jgi:GTP-dependent phosphoenolpyruvate carboxykinase